MSARHTAKNLSVDPDEPSMSFGSLSHFLHCRRATRSHNLQAILAFLLSTLAITCFLFLQLDGFAVSLHLPLSAATPPIDEKPFRLHPANHASRPPHIAQYDWRITAGERRPDGVLKRVYLVNDAFPGPTIEARSGDHLVIHVENALDDEESLSLHWHGLTMRGFNIMDGAAGMTQRSIQAGQRFTYEFTIDESQHGTFWWHAHDGVQRADGLFGGLVVHAAEFEHRHAHDEHLLMVGDWYHRPAIDVLTSYSHAGAFGIEPVPDSILVNGVGSYPCSYAVPARPVDCQVRHIPSMKLDRHKESILRVVNVGAYAGIELGIEGTQLWPVAVDGGNAVRGVAALTVGYLHPGERIDLVVQPLTGNGSDDVTLTISFDTSPFKYSNLALAPTHQFPVQWNGHADIDSISEAAEARLDLETLTSLTRHAPEAIPATADETLVLYAVTQTLAHLDNTPSGFINNTSWHQQLSPLEALVALDRSQWDKNQFVPHLPLDLVSPLWVDLVVNNLDEEGHPFHLHGHDFFVLSKYSSTSNWGSYNPFEDDIKPGGEYNLEGPLKKDTTYVPRRGYAVLRVKMDNPGIWMFHCKPTPHSRRDVWS